MSLETIAMAFSEAAAVSGAAGVTRAKVTAMVTLRRHAFRVAVSPHALGDYRLGSREIDRFRRSLLRCARLLVRGCERVSHAFPTSSL